VLADIGALRYLRFLVRAEWFLKHGMCSLEDFALGRKWQEQKIPAARGKPFR
jgi:hypothetical protein